MQPSGSVKTGSNQGVMPVWRQETRAYIAHMILTGPRFYPRMIMILA